jgi:hypothetical protein
LVPHLECQWFESIRTGLNAIDGSIECTESFLVPPAREGDTHIMDAVCDCKRYTATEIKQINACRLYLQVLLLSDVATPCGQYMIKTYHKGKRANRPNQPTISYPRQQRPNKKAWKLWRKAFNKLYLQSDKHSLLIPLGRWNTRHHMHQQWTHYIADGKLYKSTADKHSFQIYLTATITRRHTRYNPTNARVTEIPIWSQPVSVSHSRHALEIPHDKIFLQPCRPFVRNHDSIFDRIASQTTSHRELLQDVELAVDETTLANMLTTQSCILLASDGGAVPGRGSFG